MNSYALYGMELAPTTKTSTGASSSSLASKAHGILDCGATASAAPEVSAQELVKAGLSHDRQATVNILSAQRSYSRFGNGKWGRARYKLEICSDVSGQKKTFSLHALPNPIEFYQPNFDKSQLVPILIGMDHLGPHGCQMLVDFGSGLAMDGVDDNPEVYQLPVNPKKHCMYDILYHLTRGQARAEGHAQVNVVVVETDPLSVQPVLQFRPLDFYTTQQSCSSSSFASSPLKHDREELLRKLFRCGHTMAQMGTSANKQVVEAPASTSVIGNGDFVPEPDSSGRSGGAEQHQVQCDGQATCSSVGPRANDVLRPSRSTCFSNDMAVPREACGGKPSGQSTRRLGQLRDLCPPSVVPTTEGISFQPHCGPQCSDGAKGLDAAPADASWCTSNGRDCESHVGQDHRRGEVEHQGAVLAGNAQCRELQEGSKVQGSPKECGEEVGCHQGLHDGPELSGDQSFWQQLSDVYGFGMMWTRRAVMWMTSTELVTPTMQNGMKFAGK